MDTFVPEGSQGSLFGPSAVNAPMLGIRMPFATAPHHSAVAIGILQGAVNDLAASALTRKPAFNPTTLMKDDPVFRTRFGEIAVRVEALRALAASDIQILTAANREGRDVTKMEGARLSAAVALIEHEGTSLMDQMMMLSGSAGVYMTNRQQRRWRDLRCAAQHQAANIGHYGEYAVALIEQQGAHVAGASSVPSPSP
jgi:alkylation response protein AidB-like acyl-CoA dehydrogenase